MTSPDRLSDLYSGEWVAKARARGESHGFTGAFLDAFVERELDLMVKWANQHAARLADAAAPVSHKGLYANWGGRFDAKPKP